jgi:hypothetical protein
LALTGFFWALIASPQLPFSPEKTGLLFKVQGNAYERRVYDASGELTGRQLITFDRLRFQDDDCQLPLTLRLFGGVDLSEAGEQYDVDIRVECAEPHLIASVLALAADSDSQSLEIKIVGEGETYPVTPRDGQRLADVNLILKLRKGWLSLLGTKTEMKITDRRVEIPAEELTSSGGPRSYEIHSCLDLRLYILGLRWKHRSYTARQVILEDQGLVEETLRCDDGSFSVITILGSEIALALF